MGKRLEIETLTSYEKALERGDFSTPADQMLESKRTAALAERMLQSKSGHAVTLDDGTVVEPTVEEILVAKSIQRELENPKGLETIERLQKIRGEAQDAVAVSVTLVDDDLMKRALE